MSRNKSPGQELRDYLLELYMNEKSDSIRKMDDDWRHSGDLYSLFIKSAVNYLTRRILKAASVVSHTYSARSNKPMFAFKMKEYLKDMTRYNDDIIECVVKKCMLSMCEAETSYTTKMRKRMMRKKANNCYMCGCELVFSNKPVENDNDATLDHLWPNSLGGSNESFNLENSCKKCNELKGDFIDGSDYHFEQIAHRAIKVDDFIEKRSRIEERAIWAYSDYKCCVCEIPAKHSGELFIGRKDQDDIWHFLNLATYCEKHRPEELEDK